jgi:hypothetical protein
MSNEPAEKTDSPAKERPGLISRLIPGTVAGKTALATAVILLMTLIAVWVYRRFGPDSVRLHHAISWGQMLLEFALVVIIPAVLYWGVRRWNQVIEGVYPDIDRAWQAGIDALGAQGISVDDYPIFLILGSAHPELERGLISALETQVFVDGVPNEPGIRHSLQWYACTDAIYLFCPGASCLGALRSKWSPASPSASAARPQPIVERRSVADRSISPAPAAAAAAAAVPAAPTPAVASPSPAAEIRSEPNSPQSKPAPGKYLGTIQFGSETVGPTPSSSPAPSSSPGASQQSSALAPRPASSAPAAMAPVSPVSPAVAAGSESPAAPAGPASAGLASAGLASAGLASAGLANAYGGTVMADQLVSRPTGPAADTNSSPHQSGPAAVAGTEQRAVQTLQRQAPTESPASSQQTASNSAASSRSQTRRFDSSNLALPSSLDTSDQVPRLRYLSQLLRRARRPRCGINGIVTLIPFELSNASQLQISALAQSARSDVESIQQVLGIRSPVTAVLVGLEQDKGFTELVRRLQPELLSRRLGGRFDLRSRPTPDELNAHSDRLCDAFEDWVYRLFAREDALAQQRGNRKLYGLISRIRHDLKPRLRIVLGQAFGCEPTSESDTEQSDSSFFFSGCYFAAIGAITGQPAFVKGVLQDKLIEEQSQVQWTPDALRTHGWFRLFAIVGWIACLLFIVSLAAKWAGWI